MYLAYLDESGDSGISGPTRHYVVGCYLIHENEWLDLLDVLKSIRSNLRQKYNVPARGEVKASESFSHGRGVMSGTSLSKNKALRIALFEEILEHIANNSNLTSLKVFAVAINKQKFHQKHPSWSIQETAWLFALQRINRFVKEKGQKAIIFADAGNEHFLPRLVRKNRRFHLVQGHYGGVLDARLHSIVENPYSVVSHQSYFVQLADWIAFSALRYIEKVNKSYFSDSWEKLKFIQLREVNKLAQLSGHRLTPAAIVYYP